MRKGDKVRIKTSLITLIKQWKCDHPKTYSFENDKIKATRCEVCGLAKWRTPYDDIKEKEDQNGQPNRI